MTPPRRVPLTERDQEVLDFAARHRVVRTDHVQTLLGVSASTALARLRRLAEAGTVVEATAFEGQPRSWQITRRGLGAVSSPLPLPRHDLGAHTHDVGVAWLWLAARDGAFGALAEIISERELRSRDGPGRRADPPLAVRIGGVGPRGGERLHYPDLLLRTADGRRVAIELELTGKSRARRELILSAYGADPHVDHVLYLVRDRQIGRAVADTARRFGLQDIVHVQQVKLADATRSPGTARTAQRSRRPDGERSRGANGERGPEREATPGRGSDRGHPPEGSRRRDRSRGADSDRDRGGHLGR